MRGNQKIKILHLMKILLECTDDTQTYPLSKIDEAYELFENKHDGVIKVAVEC